MTKYYLATVQDRHADPENRLFSTPEKALAFANLVLHEESERAHYDSEDAVVMTKEQLKRAGLMFFQTYSCEGDYVQVKELTLDDAV